MYVGARAETKFCLRIQNKEPDFEDTMEELDFYGDKLVVFQAVAISKNALLERGSENEPIELE